MNELKKGILLSGANGFLGNIMCRCLNLMQYRTIGIGTREGQIIVDIKRPFDLPQIHFDMVVHAAGKAHVIPVTKSEQKDFFQVNLEGTKHLCNALDALPSLPRAFVFISTVAVYGVDEGHDIDEDHPANGHTAYAESKILAEQWLENWAAKHNITLGILRLPLVVGPNPPGNLGAMIRGIKSGKYLSIGKADVSKSVVWAEDIARIIPVLAEKGGTYNLTDGVHPTFGELEEAIATALNKRKPIKVPYWIAKGLAKTGDILGSRFPINSNQLKKITATLTFDDTKARNELGWNPTSVLRKIDELTASL